VADQITLEHRRASIRERIARERPPIDRMSLDDFDRMVAVNVRAVFVAAQEASRHMSAGGRIITIRSVNADRMPFAGGGVYVMTKAAVAGLTRGLAPARA
jgi:3-oxoacyl-[acyl-carrier protein] reductase